MTYNLRSGRQNAPQRDASKTLSFLDKSTIQYLTPSALSNLKHYKYSSIDKSPISKYILQPYWTFCAGLFPTWMAPNLITLLGFGFVMFNFLLLLIYTPDLETLAPSWVYVSFGVGIWLYSTFDNCDGKQARRTGTSSPLGELFDHGCDALACSFGALLQAAALQLGYSWYTLGMCVLTIIPFFFSTWEHFHTGTLYLGFINGPTEGLMLSSIVMTLSGVYSPSIWATKMVDLLGRGFFDTIGLSGRPLAEALTITDFVFAGLLVALFTMHIPASVYNIGRRTSILRVLPELAPFLVYILSIMFWLSSSTSIALSRHLVLFVSAFGIIFGRMASRIILAHLVHGPYPMWDPILVPLIVGAVFSNAPSLIGITIFTPKFEVAYITLMLIFNILYYLRYVLQVIDSFCTELRIQCLRIPTKKVSKDDEPLLAVSPSD